MSWLSYAANLATAVGVLIGAAGIVGQLGQRHEQLAQRYVDRFWAISDRIGDLFKLQEDPKYLQLCEDEMDIVRLGWIRGGTWEVWHGAITSAINTPIPADRVSGGLRLLRSCRERPNESHDGHNCPGVARTAGWRRALLRATGAGARRVAKRDKAAG